ncbi:MAG: hypothetical protein QOH15_1331 [Gaiellales bacterium]|jgi:hypothetical protein|nr:hypothetical protein [Gaiellales bacterium]
MEPRLLRREAQPVSAGRRTPKTHCNHGHEFTAENTRVTPRGWRDCRACERERQREGRKDPEYRARELASFTPERRERKLKHVQDRLSSDPEYRERLRVGARDSMRRTRATRRASLERGASSR